MKLILVRCKAHSASVCWIVRRWQDATNSYVYHDSGEDAEELKQRWGITA